jgi:hypothetical protein
MPEQALQWDRVVPSRVVVVRSRPSQVGSFKHHLCKRVLIPISQLSLSQVENA